MPRIALAESVPEDLGDLYAAATNGRRPPLNLHAQMVTAPVVLSAYVAIRRVVAGAPTADAALDALLAVAREAARNAGRVTDATWRAATDAGVTDAQLAEAYASLGLAVYVDQFVNYAASVSDVGRATAPHGARTAAAVA
jgi:nitrate reductase beta subunit